MLFIDFKQAYDTIDRKQLLRAMRKLRNLVKLTLKNTTRSVKVNGQISRSFEVNTGLRQEDPLPTTLFSLALEAILKTSVLSLR